MKIDADILLNKISQLMTIEKYDVQYVHLEQLRFLIWLLTTPDTTCDFRNPGWEERRDKPTICPKCKDEGWVCSNELNSYHRVEFDDTRYLCDDDYHDD